MTDPHIEVRYRDNTKGNLDGSYNMDTGPLWIPEHIRIGQLNSSNIKMMCFAQQVEEYEIWIKQMIQEQQSQILEALDDIYGRALGSGVILSTCCLPDPWHTHAHVVKNIIMDLASGEG